MSDDALISAMRQEGVPDATILAVLSRMAAMQREETRNWQVTRMIVLRRDGFICQYCGAPDSFQCDHVLPRSRGGRSIEQNLVASCKRCNSSKKDRTPEEWVRK